MSVRDNIGNFIGVLVLLGLLIIATLSMLARDWEQAQAVLLLMIVIILLEERYEK